MWASRRFWQISFLTLFGLFVLYLGYLVSGVLNPILLALVIAYILNPLVQYLQRFGLSRLYSVITVFAFFFGLVVIALLILIPLVSGEAISLYNQVTSKEFQNDVVDLAERGVNRWNTSYPSMQIDLKEVQSELNEFLSKNKKQAAQVLRDVMTGILQALGRGLSLIWLFFSYLILLPVFAFFFMRHLNDIWDQLYAYIPPAAEETFSNLTGKMHNRISGFFRGQLLVALIKGLIVLIGLTILDFPYSALLGLLAFIGSMVPFFIVLFSFLPALLILVFIVGPSWAGLLGLIVVYGIGEALEGTVLYPFIVGKEAGLHPLLVIVSLLVGGELLGFFGVLLSIPLGSISVIVVQDLVLPNLKEVTGQETDDPEEENDEDDEPASSTKT